MFQKRRVMSTMVQNFASSKYIDAYRALVIPQLKKVGLGEDEANKIINKASTALQGIEKPSSNQLSSELALSTFQVVQEQLNSKELGVQVARDTLISSQMVINMTNKIACKMSWNKRKFVEKISNDFCKDQKSILDAEFDSKDLSIHVKSCYFHQFFSKHGQKELTQIFCASEADFFSSANSSSFEFENPIKETIALGNSKCVLKFQNKLV